jgi:ABC-type dipeptide/oligopeptide/nickel transport system permease subunit
MVKKIIIGIGVIVFLIGLAMQARYIPQGYTKFIEGEGYITFMAGIIIIILGFAFNLLSGEIKDEGRDSIS